MGDMDGENTLQPTRDIAVDVFPVKDNGQLTQRASLSHLFRRFGAAVT